MEITWWWNNVCYFILTYYLLPALDHLSQVNDEAVSFVEAGPGQFHFPGSDIATAFNVQQSFDILLVGHHMFEAWGYSTFLWWEKSQEEQHKHSGKQLPRLCPKSTISAYLQSLLMNTFCLVCLSCTTTKVSEDNYPGQQMSYYSFKDV